MAGQRDGWTGRCPSWERGRLVGIGVSACEREGLFLEDSHSHRRMGRKCTSPRVLPGECGVAPGETGLPSLVPRMEGGAPGHPGSGWRLGVWPPMAGRRVQPLFCPELCGLSAALCPHAVAQQRLAALHHLCVSVSWRGVCPAQSPLGGGEEGGVLRAGHCLGLLDLSLTLAGQLVSGQLD